MRALLTLGRTVPILKWQSILAKWCHAACHVSLCEAVGLFLISAAARSWWGQTTFPSHLEGITGPETVLAAKQNMCPEPHTTKDASKSLFVCFFPLLFKKNNFFFSNTKKSCVDMLWYYWGYFTFWAALSSFGLATCRAVVSTGHHWKTVAVTLVGE